MPESCLFLTPIDPSRAMILRISAPAFADVLLGKCRVLGLPEEMETQRVVYDIASDCILIRAISPTWSSLNPQDQAPELRLMCERIDA